MFRNPRQIPLSLKITITTILRGMLHIYRVCTGGLLFGPLQRSILAERAKQWLKDSGSGGHLGLKCQDENGSRLLKGKSVWER